MRAKLAEHVFKISNQHTECGQRQQDGLHGYKLKNKMRTLTLTLSHPMGEGTASYAIGHSKAYCVEHANFYEPVKTHKTMKALGIQNIAAAGDGRAP